MRLRLRNPHLINSAGRSLIVPAKLETIAWHFRGTRVERTRDSADEGLAVVAGPGCEWDCCHVFAGAREFAMTFRRGAGRAWWQPKLQRELAAA